MKLGSVTITLCFISLHAVFAHINGLVCQTGDPDWADLYELDGSLLFMDHVSMCDRGDMWVLVLMHQCSGSDDRPKKFHFTCSLFAAAMGLCHPRAYAGMIMRKLESYFRGY